MAPAVASRVSRASTPDDVERDLGALWRELASQGAIARSVMANLVVFRLCERRTGARAEPVDDGELVDAVVGRHPSRTIVIEHDRGRHGLNAPAGAHVEITVFGPPAVRYGVERVTLNSTCAEPSMPSVIRRFVRGDVPTTIWWMEDLSRMAPLPALASPGRQLLYDSHTWHDVDAGVRALAPFLARGVDLADVNWRRLSALRLALRHAKGARSTVSADDVVIAHRPGDSALAWLLGGLLAARLHWPSNHWPRIVEDSTATDAVSLRVGPAPELLALLDDHRVRIELPDTPPLVTAVPLEARADAVAAELRTRTTDPALRDALTALASRLGIQARTGAQ